MWFTSHIDYLPLSASSSLCTNIGLSMTVWDTQSMQRLLSLSLFFIYRSFFISSFSYLFLIHIDISLSFPFLFGNILFNPFFYLFVYYSLYILIFPFLFFSFTPFHFFLLYSFTSISFYFYFYFTYYYYFILSIFVS